MLLVLSQSVLGQRLTGKVVDAATGQPVPYASISVLNTRLGTTSNTDGEFELRAVALPGKLVVSELGHRRDTVAVATAGLLQIRLQPASVMLPEIALGTYTEELIKKAYRQLRQSNAQKTYGQAFYRQVTRLDGDVTEVQEMVWNAQTSNAGVEGTALAQARFAKKKALLSFNNFSVYTKTGSIFSAQADSSALKGLISPGVAQNFTLELLGMTQNGAQQLVEIGFASRPEITTNHEKGSIIIDDATHQILRLRLETTGLRTKSNNPIFRFKTETTNFEWVFQPRPGGAAALEYLKVNRQASVGRLMKPDVNIQVASFTYFYDGRPIPAASVTYAPAKGGEVDLAAIKQTTIRCRFLAEQLGREAHPAGRASHEIIRAERRFRHHADALSQRAHSRAISHK